MRIRFGAYVFDSSQRELLLDGTAVPLSPKAFAMLELLVEAAPAAVSKETLYDRLWPETFVEPGNLHNLASEIRSALDDRDHAILRTVHRFGYAFTAAAVPDENLRYSVVIGGEEIPLRAGANGIGRDRAGTIVINAPDVSRHHARLIVQGTQVILEDLGSKNGTFVGTTPVTTPVVVHDGDEILIGKTSMRLHVIRRMASTLTAV
jgi:DNA-binding winged helix-turn-helix (wHTH) protein